MMGAGGRPPPSLKNHKNIGFLSHTGPDPLKKITTLPSQYSMLGHHRPASETPFQWRFADGPLMARFKWHLDRILFPLIKQKSQSWIPSGKTLWIHAWGPNYIFQPKNKYFLKMCLHVRFCCLSHRQEAQAQTYADNKLH